MCAEAKRCRKARHTKYSVTGFSVRMRWHLLRCLPHIRRLYAAYHRIGKHILHLCGGSSADLIIDAACAVTVAQHGVSAVGHITHLAQTRQFCADGFAVKVILRLLDQLYLLAYCKRLSAEAVVESGQCNIVLHLYFLQNTCFIFRGPVHSLLCLYYPLFMSNKNHFQITLVIF